MSKIELHSLGSTAHTKQKKSGTLQPHVVKGSHVVKGCHVTNHTVVGRTRSLLHKDSKSSYHSLVSYKEMYISVVVANLIL